MTFKSEEYLLFVCCQWVTKPLLKIELHAELIHFVQITLSFFLLAVPDPIVAKRRWDWSINKVLFQIKLDLLIKVSDFTQNNAPFPLSLCEGWDIFGWFVFFIELNVAIFLVNFNKNKLRWWPIEPFCHQTCWLCQKRSPCLLLQPVLFCLFEMWDFDQEWKLRFVFNRVRLFLFFCLHWICYTINNFL